MKPESSSADERRLSGLLQDWKLDAALPPRFEEQVWGRIARVDAAVADPWSTLRAWAAGVLLRPSVAVSYAVVLLLAGVAGGWWQARADTRRADQELSVHYVQMVDPYQMPRN